MQGKALTWYIKQVLNVCARMYPRSIHRDVLNRNRTQLMILRRPSLPTGHACSASAALRWHPFMKLILRCIAGRYERLLL